MCRFVVVVIFLSCVSIGVLAQGETNATCMIDPEMTALKRDWHKCFNDTVELHLNPDKVTAPGDCRTGSEFGEKLDNFIKFVNTKCNKTLSLDTKYIVKLIEFSLKNDSFKKFYDDIICVKEYEKQISNDCVKAKVGFFNITKEKTHTSWATKGRLTFNSQSCPKSREVGNCVQARLHKCKQHTIDYVAKLFNYAQELGNCSQFPDTTPFPPARGLSDAAPASWLTTPVIITLSVGAVVVVVAIIILVVFKCKK